MLKISDRMTTTIDFNASAQLAANVINANRWYRLNLFVNKWAFQLALRKYRMYISTNNSICAT